MKYFICENGHQLILKDYVPSCPKCNSTIHSTCYNCTSPLTGVSEIESSFNDKNSYITEIRYEIDFLPLFCPTCGNDHIWLDNKINPVISKLHTLFEIENSDLEIINNCLRNILKYLNSDDSISLLNNIINSYSKFKKTIHDFLTTEFPILFDKLVY